MKKRRRGLVYNARKALIYLLTHKTHTRAEWLKKLASYDTCPICGRLWKDIPLKPHMRHVWTKDHIIPVREFGHDGIDNIQPVCYKCNYGQRKKK
jgi:ribosomal protein L34E